MAPRLLCIVVVLLGDGKQLVGLFASVFELRAGRNASAIAEAVLELAPAAGCLLGLVA